MGTSIMKDPYSCSAHVGHLAIHPLDRQMRKIHVAIQPNTVLFRKFCITDIVGGVSLASSLSSSLRCRIMKTIAPIQNNKVPQSELGNSHEATIPSVH